jgi:hypothetical protein
LEIKPIIEYALLDCAERSRSVLKDIFESLTEEDHPYWGAVVERLKKSYGLYVFYDSLTRPLYVGIAKEQSIWERANQSYNVWRERNGKMMYVNHPASKVKYDPNKVKRVNRSGFSLADVAIFFSAYEVKKEYISGLEAFAIRAFGGVLLNTKMEGNGGFGLDAVQEAKNFVEPLTVPGEKD